MTTPFAAGGVGTVRGDGAGRVDGNVGVRRWLALVVLCLSLLIVSLDTTILNVALPVMARTMHASTTQLQWIADAYAIVLAGLMLVLGSLGDRIGRKRVYCSGLLVFAAFSSFAAFSGSPGRLIAARALMGVGSAAIMPCTLSLLINVFTEPTQRARAIGIWSGTSGLGVAVGPLAGGWLLDHFWWGSVFLVNVPIAALAVVGALVLVPDSRDVAAKAPDPVGASLSVVGMGLLLWGIIDAPSYGWGSSLVLGAILGGLAALGCFVAWERRSSHPMLELSLFSARRFSVAMTALGATFLALMGALFLLTQFLQFDLGYSPFAAGLRVSPVAGVLLVAAPLSMAIVRRVGTKPVAATGMGCVAFGLVLLSRTSAHGTYLEALPAFFLLGLGAGLTMAPCTDSVMGTLPLARAGVGSATNGTALQLGGALGVGVLGSLLNTRYQHRLDPVLRQARVPAAVGRLVSGSLGGALAVARQVGGRLGAALAAVSRSAFVSGMDLAVLSGAVVVAVAMVGVLVLLPNRPGRGSGRSAGARPGSPEPSVSPERYVSPERSVSPERRSGTMTGT